MNLARHKSFLVYCIFGFLATCVNMLSYELFYVRIGIVNTVSVALSWFLAVTFAFFTNKCIVFREKGKKSRHSVFHQLLYFYLCRALSGVLDVAIMYVSVDVLSLNHTLWKFISNLAVGICNYLAGRLFIFKKES